MFFHAVILHNHQVVLYLCLAIRSFYFFYYYIFTSKRENMSEIDLIRLFLMIEVFGTSLIPNPTYICKNRHTSFHRIIFFLSLSQL